MLFCVLIEKHLCTHHEWRCFNADPFAHKTGSPTSKAGALPLLEFPGMQKQMWV